MGAEQDGDLEVVANAPGDIDHALLMRGVKRDQRLVHHDEAWLADQSLAQQHELALAARAAGKLARAHFIESPVDLAPRRLVERDEAKPGADRRGGDDVPACKSEAHDRAAVLRHVADLSVAARRGA